MMHIYILCIYSISIYIYSISIYICLHIHMHIIQYYMFYRIIYACVH